MSLFFPDDPPIVRKQILRLVELGYFVERKTKYHIKIGELNYYWTTGKMYKDPAQRMSQKGFDALLEALEGNRAISLNISETL